MYQRVLVDTAPGNIQTVTPTVTPNPGVTPEMPKIVTPNREIP